MGNFHWKVLLHSTLPLSSNLKLDWKESELSWNAVSDLSLSMSMPNCKHDVLILLDNKHIHLYKSL